MRRRGKAGVGAVGETTDPSMYSISSALSSSVKAELEPDSECERSKCLAFTIVGIRSCLTNFPKGDSGRLWGGLRNDASFLVGESLVRALCRFGVRGVDKELEDEVEDGGLGIAERLGVPDFEFRSSLFGGGVGVFRTDEDLTWEGSFVRGEGETLAVRSACRALWGSGLMGRVAFCTTDVSDAGFSEAPSDASFSSSELLTRFRVPRRGGEGGGLVDSTRADLGRYLGRAEALPRVRGRSVDLLVGTAGLGAAFALAVAPKVAGVVVSLRVARLREVRVMVSPGEKVSSCERGRSPMELRRLTALIVAADTAPGLRTLCELSFAFLEARSREESLVSLFMTSASALPRTLRE